MPSYPLRPTFPIDVRSPSGTVKVGRVGTAVTVDLDATKVFEALPVRTEQPFAALDARCPGASATVRDAVPSKVASPINRACQTPFHKGCARRLTRIIAAAKTKKASAEDGVAS